MVLTIAEVFSHIVGYIDFFLNMLISYPTNGEGISMKMITILIATIMKWQYWQN